MASAPRQLRLQMTRLRQTHEPGPSAQHNQAMVRSKTSRTLAKFNIDIRDSTIFPISMIFTKSTNALLPFIPFVIYCFEMDPCVLSQESAGMLRSRSEVACRHERKREVEQCHRAETDFLV
jgi:hypothetical protein